MQDEFGLNELDFGARFYDPATARWAQLDPLAEGAADWTPYRYAFNNPMGYNDPSGMFEMPKGQFPDGFDNGSGLHLPWESGGGWSSSFGGNYHYDSWGYTWGSNGFDTWGQGHRGDVFYQKGGVYTRGGNVISFEEVIRYETESGNTRPATAEEYMQLFLRRSNNKDRPGYNDLTASLNKNIVVNSRQYGEVCVNFYYAFTETKHYVDGDNKVGGVNISVTYTTDHSLEGARWIQFYKDHEHINATLDGYEEDKPFYLSEDRTNSEFVHGNSIDFIDGPNTSENNSFRADLMLYEAGKIIFSMTWGYDYDKSTRIVTLIPYVIYK